MVSSLICSVHTCARALEREGEGKGKERKGKGKEGKKSIASTYLAARVMDVTKGKYLFWKGKEFIFILGNIYSNKFTQDWLVALLSFYLSIFLFFFLSL